MQICCRIKHHVEWQDDETAIIIYGEKQYMLKLSEEIILKETGLDDSWNLIYPVPDTTTYFCEAIEKDVILDDTTRYYVFEGTGKHVRVYHTYQKHLE